MSDIAIQFDHVSKLYRLGVVGTGTFSHDLNRWWQTSVLHREDPYLKIGQTNDRSKKGSSDVVYALKDITFDVKQGDVVGIIGKNGAGKSTLLKLLSRVTSPSTGVIRARGRIGSLLEVGTGFHPEMTGRENIYMNGSIMGMTKHEIDSKLDEIVDFAGVERYIDTPVKRYSSGMTVRLGFAVAAFMEPEILVVDEVLAVGDAEFQKKAIGKMQDVSKGGGRTVLFVSHNMGSMQRLCSRGVLLENGMVKFAGTMQKTIEEYQKDEIIQSVFEGVDGDEKVLCIRKAFVKAVEHDIITIPSTIRVEMVIDVACDMPMLIAGFNLYNSSQTPLARADYNDERQLYTLEKGEYCISFEIPPFTLAEGDYRVVFDVAQRGIKRYSTSKSTLSFCVQQGEPLFANIFAERNQERSSLVHAKWTQSIIKL